MNPDDFESCYACDCLGCNHCMQADEYYDETEIHRVDPDDLMCSCGSD